MGKFSFLSWLFGLLGSEPLVKCEKCGKEKPQSEFIKDKGKPNGYRRVCKKCKSRYEVRRRRQKRSGNS